MNSRYVCAAVALGSGLALILAILFHWQLALLLAAISVFGGGAFAVLWKDFSVPSRTLFRRRFRRGLFAGFLATLAYDACRYLVYYLFTPEFFPFVSFYHFGRLLGGENLPTQWLWLTGTAYHLFNGVSFGTAYIFLADGRHWLSGVLFALILEILMLLIYPQWLPLQNYLGELTLLSLTGHLAYGATLGYIGARKQHGGNGEMG
jgi:hypothetical protein